MPYASNIQVVTDANGTALAFLVEDGRIWQCQWNSEAQRWDKGTIVPDAFGGEKVQALVLPRFWTTANNGGTTPTTWDPGLVLAYRVGQGAEAGISASFGRWNEAGQLVWTAPVRLSQEQSGAGEFSLVAGDNSSFNLVVQQTAGAAPVSTVLDTLAQQAGGDAAAVRDQLATTITSTTPDSDLYNYRFRIDASSDVLDHANVRRPVADVDPQRRDHHADPDRRAIRAQVALVHPELAYLAGIELRHVVHVLLRRNVQHGSRFRAACKYFLRLV
jgi:hypothetical protein